MIASIYGRESGGRMTYNAVKAAEISLAKAMAQQLAKDNIRVNSVAPGLTDWLVADTGNRNVVTNPNGANTDVFSPHAPRRAGLPERFAVFFGQFAAWQVVRRGL